MTNDPPPPRHARRRRWLRAAAGALALYLLAAYVVVPLLWESYGRRHPAFEHLPRITYTGAGIPGDPLNVALFGTEAQVKKLLVAARWYPADPLTFKSCLEIAEATVLRRPYDEAPVSNLYFEGRKEDLAFEKPVGDDPRKRHHVRFWKTGAADADGRPLWVGAAIYDERVGLSHTTGQITHHTGADIDAERDFLFRDLQQTGDLARVFFVADFHPNREGRNGGGDLWRTDGRLEAGVIGPGPAP
jgi:hypothetical protein